MGLTCNVNELSIGYECHDYYEDYYILAVLPCCEDVAK